VNSLRGFIDIVFMNCSGGNYVDVSATFSDFLPETVSGQYMIVGITSIVGMIE